MCKTILRFQAIALIFGTSLFVPASSGFVPAKVDTDSLKVEVQAYKTPSSVDDQTALWALQDPAYGYRFVIMINKSHRRDSSTGQTLRVFRLDVATLTWQHLAAWDVSTGSEVEAPSREHFHTRPGIFRAESMKVHYVAKSREKMPYSIFFDERFGTAIHQTRKDWYKYLGNRKSHGCVRQEERHAEYLYGLLNPAMDNRPPLGPIVELVPLTGRPNMIEQEIRTVTMPDGKWKEEVVNEYTRQIPRVIMGINALVVITDPASNHPSDLKIDPTVYQNQPNKLFEFFPKWIPGRPI